MLSKPVDRLRVVLPSVAVSPGDGLTRVRVTMPENPLILLAAMGVDCGQRGTDDGPLRLQLTVTGVEGAMLKSCTVTVVLPLLPLCVLSPA